MATSNYKGTRLPLIALDYNSRFLAEKKEILFDYKTGKLYVVSAEDKSVIFDITRNILKEVEKNVDLSSYTFNVEGVGIVNLDGYIKHLSKYNLNTVDEPVKRYRVPQITFDNDSIVDYAGTIEINGFSHAANNTYPVKDGNIVKWVQRTDTDIVERVRHLEETAPPDAVKFKKLQDDVAAVKFTANQYSNLPVLRTDIDAATRRLDDLNTLITTTNDNLNTKITGVKNAADLELNKLSNKITVLEAREDYGSRVNTLEGKVNELKALGDPNSKILALQQRIANLEQGEDYSVSINTLGTKINTLSDSTETKFTNMNQEIGSLKAYNNENTQIRTSILGRLDTIDSLNIAPTLTDLKARTQSLEGIPNLTSNIANLESTTNTLTNSFSQLNAKVTGLLNAEDPLPRVKGLENYNTNKENLPQEAKVNLAGGSNKVIRPDRVYNFILDSANPSFTIVGLDKSTAEIILILDPQNIGTDAINIFITRADGVQVKIPRRIIPSKNKEAQLVRLVTYDRGVNWFYSVAAGMIGKDLATDNTI